MLGAIDQDSPFWIWVLELDSVTHQSFQMNGVQHASCPKSMMQVDDDSDGSLSEHESHSDLSKDEEEYLMELVEEVIGREHSLSWVDGDIDTIAGDGGEAVEISEEVVVEQAEPLAGADVGESVNVHQEKCTQVQSAMYAI